MENSNENNSAENKKSNRNILKIVLLTLAVVLVLAAVGAGAYLFNKYRITVNSRFNSLEESDKTTSSSIKDLYTLNSRIDGLQSEIGKLQTTSPSYTYVPKYADMTIEKIIEDKNTALEDGYRFLIFDVKLVNNYSETIYFNNNELKLKDKDNYEYTVAISDTLASREFVKKDAKVLLPDNRILSGWAMLNPGETVRTSIGFVLNRPGTEYNLYRTDTLLRAIKL